jgi:hypothetical protein
VERLGADVERELARSGPAPGMLAVVGAWPEAVGETVARNAWPARLSRDGTLHVAARSAAWAFELTQLAPAVLERLAATLADAAPRAVRFAPGPVPEAGGACPPAAEKPPPASPEERRRAERLAAEIDNGELRALVARAAAASLARAESDHRFW